MRRRDVRASIAPLSLVLLLLASACGQKPGVAGSVAAPGEGTQVAGTDDFGVTPTDDTPVDGETPTDGGGAAEEPGAGGGGGGAGPAGGGGGGGGDAGPTTATRTGISSSVIKIGIHAPESGAAAVSTFRQAVGVYSQYAGAIKGLGGRKIEVIAKDDHFDPATARTVCKELVEKEKVFLLIGGAGVDQIKSCAEYAASAGVPY